ncbi:hypothetical protein ABZS79_15900 [Streptomyces griseoloalbus]|uniref:hypothetical protein n=1 Tax=Streptomyces griseoloalbus TaxID=67303 RepID=UPI0033BF1282
MAAQRKLLTRRSGAVTAAVALGALTVGMTPPASNGIKDLSAKEIAERAIDATRNADSLQLESRGEIEESRYRTSLALDKRGDCRATDDIDGESAQAIKTGDTTYTKGNDAFWKNYVDYFGGDAESATRVAEFMKDRWLSAPSGGDPVGLAQFCDADFWLQGIGTGGLRKAGTTEVDGQPTVTLTRKKAGATDTWYVASEGQPYLLKFTSVGGDWPVESTVKDYNRPIGVEAPPADDVVDLNRFRELW